jgi:hypothetical protein
LLSIVIFAVAVIAFFFVVVLEDDPRDEDALVLDFFVAGIIG